MEEQVGLWRKGPWTAEEDRLLIKHVKVHGEGRWNSVARLAGLQRNAKSCRLRWVNYLRPDLKRGKITPHEESIILDLHARWGNRWSTIARSLPGRTDNEIKNYWRTHFKNKGKTTSCLEDSIKLKARLLKRQRFQQEQQKQQQLQLQQKNDDKFQEDMKKSLMLLVADDEESRVVWPQQDMVIPQEIQNLFYPPTLMSSFADDEYSNHQQVNNGNNNNNYSMNEDFVLWDGLWNIENINVVDVTTKGRCVHGLSNMPAAVSFY